MDALIDLLGTLLLLSGLFGGLALLCDLIERLSPYPNARVRRSRTRPAHGPSRQARPRRRRDARDGDAVPLGLPVSLPTGLRMGLKAGLQAGLPGAVSRA
jgi:hypothetical protein